MTRTTNRRPLLSLYAANAVSLSGNVAALIAIPWFVLQTTGSATRTGITAFAGVLPVVLSGVFGGALVDRLGYRRMSVIADLASAVCVAAIPLLHALGALSFPGLLLLVFLGGLLDAPGGTARTALLPDLATQAGWSFERASGALAVVERASRLVGAPAAGLLIAITDPTTVLWIDAATFVVSAAIVLLLVPHAGRRTPEPGREGYVRELRAGFAFLRGDHTLAVLIAVVAITNALDAVSLVALPVLARDVYGSAASLGLLMGAVGAGSIVGALVFASVGDRYPRRAIFCWGFLVVAIWYPFAAALVPLAILVAAKLVSGLASGPLNPLIDTVFFERVPDGMRGRVFGVTQASAWLAMPVGVLVAGPLIEGIGLRATFLVTGTAYVGVILVSLLLPALRGLDAQPPATAGRIETVSPSATAVSSDPR